MSSLANALIHLTFSLMPVMAAPMSALPRVCLHGRANAHKRLTRALMPLMAHVLTRLCPDMDGRVHTCA